MEHRYTWQGGKLIAEYWDGGKAMEFFYGPDGSIDGFAYKASPNGTFYVCFWKGRMSLGAIYLQIQNTNHIWSPLRLVRV